MESPNPNANNSIVVSDALIDPSPSGEDPVIPQDSSENLDQDREYGCKYCHKKFTNKQALGGHQNAHKVERAMEKSARELHGNNNFGYFSGSSSYSGMSSTPLIGSYNRSNDFLNRTMINHRPYGYHQHVQNGALIGYNARPRVPVAGDPYTPVRPLLGYNNVPSGWAEPLPRIPQFNQHPSYMQNHASNHRFSIRGADSSSVGPVSQGSSPYCGSRFRPSRDQEGENNYRINDDAIQQVEDSDLDLSLKL